MEILGMGFLTALGFYIIMCKINLPFFVKYQWQTDLIVSGTMTFIFFGTFTGMAVAIVAGIFLSLFLFFSQRFV
jgi:hypothetical protein